MRKKMSAIGVAVAVMSCCAVQAKAAWKYESKADPFTDKPIYSRAINLTPSDGQIFGIMLVCEKGMVPYLVFPNQSPLPYPDRQVKYRVDKGQVHKAKWISPYRDGEVAAIDDKDWATISSESRENSTLVIGFEEFSNVLSFDMVGFRETTGRVIEDCKAKR